MSATKGARFAAFGALILLAACSGVAPIVPVTAPPTDSDASSLTLRVTDYLDISGWNGDDHASVLPTLIRSCEKIEAKDPSASLGSDLRMGRVEDWMAICADARKIRPGNMVEAKYFFESRFIAYRVGDVHDTNGLFTGYYEPELNGRWVPQEGFQTPIYARPKDIISINLADFRSMYVGAKLVGRMEGNTVIPYYTRAEINEGALKGRELEILWVDSPVDAFFMHIQGSGRIKLQDGSHVRVGYAGRNGHEYKSIGRVLVDRNVMPLEQVTAPAIRNWLATNPDLADELMNQNRSFVFFRVIEGDGPIGAQGIPLTPGRSLAVDRTFLPLGIPIWLDTTDPLDEKLPLQRLMVAQDTGSAIKGAVRGDVFWGFGNEAARRAGLMKQNGSYFVLLPRSAARPAPVFN